MATDTLNDEIIRDMREACRLMGWSVTSSDRFVRQALEHLCEVELTIGGVDIRGNNQQGWNVRGETFNIGGHTLVEALTGAIFAVKAEL